MVTAPAPALSDSHALPQAAVGAASNSPTSLNSFLSVFQSLPAHASGSEDPSLPQNSTSKVPGGKKTSTKGTEDNLVAIVSATTMDPSTTRPMAPAHPSFSLTGRDHGAASAPANDAIQIATARQESSLLDAGNHTDAKSALPNGTKYVAKADVGSADIGSMVQSDTNAQIGLNSSIPAGSRSSYQNDVRSALPDTTKYVAQAGSFQADAKPALQAALNSGVQSAVQFAGQQMATDQVNLPNTPAITESANQLAARRAPTLNSQVPASAPSSSIGAPALPAIPQVSSLDAAEPASPPRPARSTASSSSQGAVDPSLFTKGLAATLAPRQDNLAFSLKMAESNSTARRAQQATQPEPTEKNGIPPQAKSQERTPALTLQASAPHAAATPAAVTGEVAAVASTMNHAWNAAATPQLELHTNTQFTETRETANLSTVAAMHEAQQILPETARPTAAAEIMLQLGGKDQAAAIRVTDRAGTVNVSVHAADADLRTSLRSNLGDLASQLSHQGWKTEVVKTATALTRAETSQDPQQNGQRSPNQQQPSSQGDRQQPQRDRRSNSGQWLAEFEEQSSGNSGGTK